jgi:hypothetical protein
MFAKIVIVTLTRIICFRLTFVADWYIWPLFLTFNVVIVQDCFGSTVFGMETLRGSWYVPSKRVIAVLALLFTRNDEFGCRPRLIFCD